VKYESDIERTSSSPYHVEKLQGFMVDALVPNADEGRGSLRKVSGSREQALIREYPNGETHWSEPPVFYAESIGVEREPGELKHLSTQRKRKYSQSSGERNGKSPNPIAKAIGGCRARHMRDRRHCSSEKVWESLPKRVRAPYAKEQ
jgi:hypothetical protein